MPFYLAIDGGGTKTQALLANEAGVLARATTGTVKLMRVSEPEATARLHTLLEDLSRQSGVPLSGISRTCFGLSGSASQSVHDWATAALKPILPGELLIIGDVDILLDAAFPGSPGIVVIAGTGSNCIGRSASGELHTAGGWGPVLGDEGSGFWIGLEGIRAALRAQDRLGIGGVSTCLLREVERHWGLHSTGELIALGNLRTASQMSSPPDFASLAPVVARCAADGDALAQGILQRAGEELADLVTLVFYKMTGATVDPHTAESAARSSHPHPPIQVEVAFTGSVLAHIPAVRESMVARLATSIPTAQVRSSPTEPLDGALYRARQG
jgi:glucosamine kinase